MDAIEGLADIVVEGPDDPGALFGLRMHEITEQLLGESSPVCDGSPVDDDEGGDEDRQ